MSAILRVSIEVVDRRAGVAALDLWADAGVSSGQTIQGIGERRLLNVSGTVWQITRWGERRWQLEKQTPEGSWLNAWGTLDVADPEVAAYWALRIVAADALEATR